MLLRINSFVFLIFLTDKQVAMISASVESALSGKPLEEITLITVTSSVKNANIPDSLLNQVLYEAYTAIKQADKLDIYLQGEHRMLSLPDFNEMGVRQENCLTRYQMTE